MNTLTHPHDQSQVTEFLVVLTRPDSHSLDVLRERRVSVEFDSGVKIDWHNWLAYFNKHECWEYEITEIHPHPSFE